LAATPQPAISTAAGTPNQASSAPTAATPLVFDFPTPAEVATVSNLRPPLEAVPLAVRAEDHFWLARPIGSDSVNYALGSYRYGADYFGQMSIHAGIDIDAPLLT